MKRLIAMTSDPIEQSRPPKRNAPAVRGAVAAFTLGVIAQAGFAQSTPTQIGQPQLPTPPSQIGRPNTLKPQLVEQGVGDLNPLQTSNRLVPQDLRQPTGFDRVYRLSGDPAKNNGSGLFARMDGGITAVFPWSTYGVSRKGDVIPTVPPGTKYYIGAVPQSALGSTMPVTTPDAEKSFNFVDRSARPSASAERPAQQADNSIPTSARHVLRGEGSPDQPAVKPSTPPSIWTSETYRRARLEELITQAGKE